MPHTGSKKSETGEQTVEEMVRQADEYFGRQYYEEAQDLYEAAIGKGALGKAPAMLIAIAATRGKTEEALKMADSAIKENPKDWAAYESRAIALTYMHRHAEAVDDYSLVVQNEPDYNEVYYIMGYSLSALGRREEAVDAYKKSIARVRDPADSVYALCVELETLGRYTEALDLLKEYVLRIKREKLPISELDKNRLYTHMGRVYGRLGCWKHAYAYHVKSVTTDKPEPGHEYYDSILASYRKITGIRKWIKNARPYRSDSLYLLAYRVLEEDWFENAANILDTATRMNPMYYAHLTMADIFEGQQHLHTAIKHYRDAIMLLAEANERGALTGACEGIVGCSFRCGLYRDALLYVNLAKQLGIDSKKIKHVHTTILKEHGKNPENEDQVSNGWTVPEWVIMD